jgi:hypothetical protein
VSGDGTLGVVALLSARYFNPSPVSLGLATDGDGLAAVAEPRVTLSRFEIARMPNFLTLSGAFALGLFAQIGVLSHLIVRLTPDFGVASAGLLISLATVCAVIGRTLAGWWIGDYDRRIAAAINFAVQITPLIAQKEFNREDVVTVVALVVAINQAVFAFAPAIVGAIRDATSNYALPVGIVACIQLLAIMIILLGRGATGSPRTPA